MANKYEHLKKENKIKKEYVAEEVKEVKAKEVKPSKKDERKICQNCLLHIQPNCDKHKKFTKRKATCNDFILK